MSNGPDAPATRTPLAGFLLSGLLLSFLGAILPAWGHHLDSNFLIIGYYFLSLNVGIAAAALLGGRLVHRYGTRFLLIAASAIACAAFLFLAAVPPAASAGWRDAGLFPLGLSAGLLNTAVFHALSPAYRRDPASTVNFGGILLGLGCVATALLVSGTFYVYTVPSILCLFAIAPGLYAIWCAKSRFPAVEATGADRRREMLAGFHKPAAILFTLLLFFQFGNEWSIAGWLPIFLIREIGIGPEGALTMLALYWSALLAGRIVAQALLHRIGHTKLLAASAVSALFGCVLLAFTPSRVGAAVALILIGGGFASIYPMAVERIGHRFTYYHPGLYNGVFSFALTGGLLAPWTLGYFANAWGIRAVMLIPTLGTCAVVALVALISIESTLSASARYTARA